MISRTHVAIRYKFLRVKCGNRQASKNVLEELPDTMAADVDTFRGPRIRTNIGPARIGMNGLYQSVEITIFECPSIRCTTATGLSGLIRPPLVVVSATLSARRLNRLLRRHQVQASYK